MNTKLRHVATFGFERGENFVGLQHFGIWVDDIDTTKKAIETHGGRFHTD